MLEMHSLRPPAWAQQLTQDDVHDAQGQFDGLRRLRSRAAERLPQQHHRSARHQAGLQRGIEQAQVAQQGLQRLAHAGLALDEQAHRPQAGKAAPRRQPQSEIAQAAGAGTGFQQALHRFGRQRRLRVQQAARMQARLAQQGRRIQAQLAAQRDVAVQGGAADDG